MYAHCELSCLFLYCSVEIPNNSKLNGPRIVLSAFFNCFWIVWWGFFFFDCYCCHLVWFDYAFVLSWRKKPRNACLILCYWKCISCLNTKGTQCNLTLSVYQLIQLTQSLSAYSSVGWGATQVWHFHQPKYLCHIIKTPTSILLYHWLCMNTENLKSAPFKWIQKKIVVLNCKKCPTNCASFFNMKKRNLNWPRHHFIPLEAMYLNLHIFRSFCGSQSQMYFFFLHLF